LTTARLIRSRTVLKLENAPPDRHVVIFRSTDEDNPEYYRSHSMERSHFEDLGSPTIITITVEPGDTING